MPADPFASSTVSLVLAWACALPFLIYTVSTAGALLISKTPGVPKWFLIWTGICIVALSPFRYIILQFLFGAAFPVQSWRALLSSMGLVVYVPIVFGILFAIGLVLPLIITLWVGLGNLDSPRTSGFRLLAGFIVAPVASSLAYVLFFWALQYAAISTHWLRADDVIGSTNGPAQVVYGLGLGRVLPLPVSGLLTSVTRTDRDMLRNHVATYYLGRREFDRYVHEAYPALYNSLRAAPNEAPDE
jgi:hypothetical protein